MYTSKEQRFTSQNTTSIMDIYLLLFIINIHIYLFIIIYYKYPYLFIYLL